MLLNDHNKIHALAQEYVDKNAQGATSAELDEIATELERATTTIFRSLDGVKRAYCNQLKPEGRHKTTLEKVAAESV